MKLFIDSRSLELNMLDYDILIIMYFALLSEISTPLFSEYTQTHTNNVSLI